MQQTPPNIPQIAFDWYDEYAHGKIDRRTFLARLGTLAAAGFAMSTLTAALMPDYALAAQVNFNDADIKATYTEFPSPAGHSVGRGYLVTPSKPQGTLPMVLVVHENRGLNPYIEDVARRLAKQGYIAFAPDGLATLGGYPGNDDKGREMQASMDPIKLENDFIAAAEFLKKHERCNGKVGVVGFCYGGYISNMLAAVRSEIISAAVPYYGTPPKNEVVSKVKGPLLIQLAELDKRINDTWPAYEANLKANKADYTMHLYPNTNHGFHNDSTARYDKEAAELSWSRTLAFFGKHLKT